MATTSAQIAKCAEPVCIVVSARTDTEFDIFVLLVDLTKEEEEITELVPAFRISCPSAHPLVVVSKSTLYIFCKTGSKAYKYTFNATERCDDIDLESCQPITPVPSYKREPVAQLIETESGPKVLVFSRTLYQGHKNFELYDINSDTWRVLPEPMDEYYDPQTVSYYFLDGTEFSVSMSGGSFYMDFSQSDEDGLKWEPSSLNSSVGFYRHPILRDGPWLITSQMKLNDLNDPYERREVDFHPHVNIGTIRSWFDDYIFRLPPKGGERLRACIVRLGRPYAQTDLLHIGELYVLQFHGKKLIPDIAFSKSFCFGADVLVNDPYLRIRSTSLM